MDTCVRRGELYTPPSEFFFYCKIIMRGVFNTLHEDALKEGKDSITKLSDAIKHVLSSQVTIDFHVPDEVISFFSKIPIYFRLRYLNNNIKYRE